MANAAIATVVSVVGKAYARNADGELRELRTGDVLVEGETVVTPDGGRVELSMTDGSPLVINDMPETTLTRDLMAETAAGPDESAVQDETIDQVLAALESGEDLGDVLEATAAGASGGEGGEGNSFIRLGRIAEDTSEFSGLLGSEGVVSDVPEDENFLPVDAEDDTAETDAGESVVIDVQANDEFPEGGFITSVTQPEHGTVIINPDNTVTYIPEEGFSGEDMFTYVATSADGTGQDDAQVTVTVNPDTVEPTPVQPEPEPVPVPDPEPPTISIGDDTVIEGGTASVTVTLSKPWTETVTVNYITSDGSAVAPGDYDSSSGTVTFAPGETTATISIVTNSDDLEEGTENLNITLNSPTNATIANGDGVVTITDGFTPPPPPPPPVVNTNAPPVAVDDSASTEANTSVDIVVLGNDSDPDNDPIDINGFTQPANGTVVQNQDGTFTYTPDQDFSGNDTFTYTITDGELTSTAEVNIFVDDNPIEISDENPNALGIQRILDEALLSGGTQQNPDALKGSGSFDITAKDGLGSLTVNGEELIDGSGALIEDTVVLDNSGGGYVEVTFTSMDGPTADGVYTINYDVNLLKPFTNEPGSDSVDVGFEISALDSDGDPTGPVTRSATIQDDNPIANDDTNGIGPDDEGLINGDVFLGDASGGVADLPGADGAMVTSISFVGEDTIEEEKDVTNAGTTIAGDYGDLTIKSDGTYQYQLNQAGLEAIDALDGEETIDEQFTYILTDGDTDTDPATLTITLDGRNDPPVATDDEYETEEDTTLTIVPAGVLGNDSDPDGDSVMVTDNTEPENGTLTLNVDGSFEYTPNENFNGVDTFEYTITDGKGETDTATVRIIVNSVNDLSDLGESISTTEDTPVSAGANELFLNTDNPDGGPLSVTQFTWGANIDVVAGQAATIDGVGTLLIGSDGSYTFTPAEDYAGAVPSATYDVTDDIDTVTSTLAISITPANDLSDLGESISTTEDTPVSAGANELFLNTDNPDGGPLSVTQFTWGANIDVVAGQAATIDGVGTLLIGSDGSYTFTPAEDYAGAVPSATYDVTDDIDTVTSTLAISITPANDLSDLGESISTTEDTPVSAGANELFLNTDNPDGGPLSVTQFTWGANVNVVAGQAATIDGVGTLLIGSDGSYTFTPAEDYAGAVPSATYDVTDDIDTVTSTLAISITPANDLSDLGESISTTEDTPVSAGANELFLNTDNPDGGPLSVTQFTWGANIDVVAGQAATIDGVGTLLIGSDGSYTFTPAEDYAGAVPSATYDVTDDIDTVTSTLAISITPANDLSDLGESISTTEDTPVSAGANELFLNTDNPDGGPLSVTQFTWGANVNVVAGQAATIDGVGTLLIGSDGSYTFTPAEDYAGAVPSATYDVTDDIDTVTSTLAISITPANDLSDLGESISTTEDTPVSAGANELFLNTDNPDGGPLSVTQFTWGANVNVVAGQAATIDGVGTLLIGSDGSYTFTPAEDYAGAVPSATYDVTDDIDTVTSTLAISITPVNDLPEIDMSLSGMDVDEGHLIIGNDYVDPQTSDPQTTDAGSIGFKTGDQPFTLNIGSATFTSLAAITAAGGTTIGTEHGTLTFGALTGPVDGTYTLAYSYQLDEAEDHSTSDADPGQDRILVTLVDNDGDNVGNKYITVDIVDDKPVGFDPDSAFVVDGSGVASDIPLNFSNSVGADDLGSVVFSPIAGDNTAKDVTGNILKIEGKPLFFYTSDDGLELTVATASPYDGSFVEESDLVALTFEINGDSYTLTSNNGVISNGTDLSNADLSGVRGGNSEQLLLIDAFESSSNSLLDVLASGVGNSADNTVNSNDFSMGVGAGNDVDFKVTGDVLTLEFVSGLSATDEFGNSATTYDNRIGVNNFKLPLLNVRNEATLTVTLYNGDALPENLVDTLEYNTTTDGLVIPDGVDSRIDNYFTISTEENFTTVVIEATAGNFKVGQFALTEFVEGQPVNLSVGVTGIDADDIVQVGDDSVEATIDVTVQAANDNLVDASSDPLTGTSEDDIFIWELADATSENDVVVDFGAEGNDILDLRDILQLEDSGVPGEIGNLDNYLSVSLEGSDTVIGVSSAGAFTGAAEDVNFIDQTITLQNVDLVSGNGDLEGIIQNMLDSGKLLTD